MGRPMYRSSFSRWSYICGNSRPVSQKRISSTWRPSSSRRRSMAVESFPPETEAKVRTGLSFCMVLLLGSNTSDLLSRKPERTQAFNADSAKRPQRRFGLDKFYQCRICRVGVTTRGDPLVAQMVEGVAGQAVLGIVQRQLAGLRFVQLGDEGSQVVIRPSRCPVGAEIRI